MGRDHKTMALNYYKPVTLSICLSSKPELINIVRKHVNFEYAMIGLVIDSECPCLGVYQMPNSIVVAVVLVVWKSLALFSERFYAVTSHSWWRKRILYTEAAVQSCSVEKVFLEISQNLQVKTCTRFSFLIKL